MFIAMSQLAYMKINDGQIQRHLYMSKEVPRRHQMLILIYNLHGIHFPNAATCWPGVEDHPDYLSKTDLDSTLA